MPMTVPTLDHTVFTPGPARDYAAHALQIAREFPDYAKQFQQAQAAEMQRQIALQKYQNDALKAQAFLDMYPEYRAAEIAKLRASAAQANAAAQYDPVLKSAHADYFRARAGQYSDTPDPETLKRLSGGGFRPPPLGEGEAGPAATEGSPSSAPPPPAAVDDATLFGL